MRALVLAGGKATRLRPLTERIPKAMTPVLGRPFLEHVFAWLVRHDVRDVTLLLGFLPEPIRTYFGDGFRFGVNLSYVVEETPLGSGGAIKQLERELTEPFFALNGDVFTHVDLTRMRAAHADSGAAVSMYLKAVDDPSAYGVAAVDAASFIRRFVEKPPRAEAPSNLINAGVWLLQPEALARIPDGFSMVEQELFPALAAEGRLYGFQEDDYWMDAGTPERYLQLQRDLLSGQAAGALAVVERRDWPGLSLQATAGTPAGEGQPPRLGAGVTLVGAVVLGAGVTVGAESRIEGPVTVGARGTVGQRVSVADSILWEACRVGEGAHIRGSVLAGGCTVGAGALVEDSVLGEGAHIQPGATVRGRSVNPGEVVSAASA